MKVEISSSDLSSEIGRWKNVRNLTYAGVLFSDIKLRHWAREMGVAPLF